MKTENPTASHNAVPYQRYGHTVVAYNGKAYLWGGRNDEYGACSRMHVYDPGLIFKNFLLICAINHHETGFL